MKGGGASDNQSRHHAIGNTIVQSTALWKLLPP